VTIDDATEQQWLTQNFGWTAVWTGLTDQSVEGTWAWAGDGTAGYTNWASGQPQSQGDPSYDYAYMNSDGRWYAGQDGWGFRALIELGGAEPGTKGPGRRRSICWMWMWPTWCRRG